MITEKWEMRNQCQSTYFIELNTNAGVIAVFTDSPEKTEEVAHLIVNAPQTKQQRDELLKACKKALEFVGRSSKTDWDNEITPVLEQAIANATEE